MYELEKENVASNNEEVILVTTNTNFHGGDHVSESDKQEDSIIQCKFIFRDKQTCYSLAFKTLLYSIVNKACTLFAFNHIFANGLRNSDEFHIYVQSNSSVVLDFANYLSEFLPVSIDFTFINIELVELDDFNDCMNAIESMSFEAINKSCLQIPNVKEIHSILDSNDKSCNIESFLKILNCNFCNENIALDSELASNDIQDIIKKLTHTLIDTKTIYLERNKKIFKLSLQKYMNDSCEVAPHVLFADLDSAQNFLRLNDSQKSVLASFEKPFVKTACKEIFFNEFDSYDIFTSLSSDLIVLLLLSYLKEYHEIEYLFYSEYTNTDNINTMLSYIDSYPMNDNVLSYTYSVSQNIYISHLQNHKSLFEILQTNRASNSRFIVFLSTRNNSSFLIENISNKDSVFKQILDISFTCNLVEQLKVLNSYDNGDKLIKNFARENKQIVSKWNLSKNDLEFLGLNDILDIQYTESSESRHINSSNLIDIFLLIANILDLETNVFYEANKCVRDRGPRIDYKLKKHNDSIIIDYARILRSVMSFKLAGVESELLCYGVIDSLAEFIGTLSSDMYVNYGISEVFICGDLLLQQCFLDKILKCIPKNIKLLLPKNGSVDYLA